MSDLALNANVEDKILVIRGQRVILDRDLAKLYGVETKYLNRQVRRNSSRFPKEYMFQLSQNEKSEVVTNWHHLRDMKFSHQLPFAFTEHGVAMLSAVLNSERAVKMSIYIINVFVRLRQMVLKQEGIEKKLFELENIVEKHDIKIQALVKALRQMLTVEECPKKRIGFLADKGEGA